MGLLRRAKGEGAIRLRSDGRWESLIWLPTTSGTTKRFSVYGKTKAEVSRKMAELRQRAKANSLTDEKPVTLRQHLEKWASQTAAKDGKPLKPKSMLARKLNTQRISTIIGGVRLDRINGAHIRQMDTAFASQGQRFKHKGLSGASRRQAFAALRAALLQAVDDEQLQVSPFRKIHWLPEIDETEIRVLTLMEKAKLLSVDDEWTPLWKVLLATGMRSGEALGLQWEDVDFSAGTLRIQRTIQAQRGGWGLVPPKTKNSQRTLRLEPIIADVFHQVKARQIAESERLGQAWKNKNNFIFTWYFGDPILPHNAHYTLTQQLKRLSIPKARVHDLRHTYASDQLLAGTQMAAVSKVLGHSSVAFTLKVYAHILPEVESKAAEVAASMLAEAMRLAQLPQQAEAGVAHGR